MAIELTDEERAAIKDAATPPTTGDWTWRMECESVFFAGVSAGYKRGIEDAAKCCEDLPWSVRDEDPPPTPANCAAAIRALAE